MTAPVNGTDERLDVLIALVEMLLAELRQACAAAPEGDKPVAKKKK